jgi:hypothetical protein
VIAPATHAFRLFGNVHLSFLLSLLPLTAHGPGVPAATGAVDQYTAALDGRTIPGRFGNRFPGVRCVGGTIEKIPLTCFVTTATFSIKGSFILPCRQTNDSVRFEKASSSF